MIDWFHQVSVYIGALEMAWWWNDSVGFRALLADIQCLAETGWKWSGLQFEVSNSRHSTHAYKLVNSATQLLPCDM